MNAPGPNPPRRSGQLHAGSGRGELPLWAVLVVSAGVLALGLGGGRAESRSAGALSSDAFLAGGAQSADDDGRGSYRDVSHLAPSVPDGDARSSGREALLTQLDLESAFGGGSTEDGDSRAATERSSNKSDTTVRTTVDGPHKTADRDAFSIGATEFSRLGLREEGSFREGVRHGLWRAWREDGSLRSQGVYVSGLRDGVWETFSEGGFLMSELTFESGSRSGDWTAYSSSGSVLEEGQYTDNTASGRWTTYYSGGQVKERGLFVNGLREGPWEFFDDLGLPTLQAGEYRAGIKVQ